MYKRVTTIAALIAALITTIVVATPAFAAGTNPWVGFCMPGVPDSTAPLNALESKVATSATVVNFFISDSEGFPSSRVSNTAAEGAIPLITLEFWSTQNGGLATITNGSRDAYLKTFADAAKATGKTIWLRPFHEMNGNWYPWGTVSGNSPAKLIAAYRHVHDIFVAEGATNVKFVWCPNVDYKLSSFYPGNAYVDYAAIDGYNNGKPWRSFSNLFGATYNAVAAASTKPIFLAETGCVEGGSGKAAWITDMFKQISTKYTRIVGVCWFDANQVYDWRLETSSASLNAFRAAACATYAQPYSAAIPVPGSVCVKASAKSVQRKHAVKISGVLGPSTARRTVKIAITMPNHKGTSRRVVTNAVGKWSFTYKPTVRGTYYLRASFAGDSGLTRCASKTIKLVVK